MTKRKDDAELELEIRSMTIESMKSELESMGVSLLGLAEKEDLIDALLRARNVAVATSFVSPMPASLRALAKQFEDADLKNEAHDIVSDATTLIYSAWSGTMKVTYSGTKHGVRLTDAITRSITQLDALSLKYINIVPAECTVMVGDAFNSDRFIRDHNVAFNALKSFEFDSIGSIGYEHIHSVLDEFQEDWPTPIMNEMKTIFHFCRRIVELTQSFKNVTGRRIANDDGDAILHDDKWGTIASYSEDHPKDGSNCATVCVRTTGCYNHLLYILDNNCLCFLPDNANLLAYIRLDKCIVNRAPFVYDASASRDTYKLCPLSFGTEFDWVRLFGNTADPLLTPRMAARIHDRAMNNAEQAIYLNWKENRLVPDLTKDAESFFKRSFQWREDFTKCYMRIGLRLQRGLLPRPNCYGENIAFHNIMKKILSDLDDDDEDDDDDDRPWMHSVTLYTGDLAYRLECNDKNALEMNCHPSKWFHAFNAENFSDHLTGVPSKKENCNVYPDPGQRKITSFFGSNKN